MASPAGLQYASDTLTCRINGIAFRVVTERLGDSCALEVELTNDNPSGAIGFDPSFRFAYNGGVSLGPPDLSYLFPVSYLPIYSGETLTLYRDTVPFTSKHIHISALAVADLEALPLELEAKGIEYEWEPDEDGNKMLLFKSADYFGKLRRSQNLLFVEFLSVPRCPCL